MTDLELTKKCAEAMGIALYPSEYPGLETKFYLHPIIDGKELNRRYDPLHDDAQAMALVKKLALDIYAPRKDFHWIVGTASITRVENTDLNRAIVECVAKLQGAQ